MTERQLEILEDFGYDTNTLSDDDAKSLLDKLAENNWQPLPGGPPRKPLKDGSATKKQRDLLAKYGYPTDVTFAEASATIDAIRENGWKRPESADEMPKL